MAAIAAVGQSPAHPLVPRLEEWQALVWLGLHLLSWRWTDMECLSVYTTDLTITVTLVNKLQDNLQEHRNLTPSRR